MWIIIVHGWKIILTVLISHLIQSLLTQFTNAAKLHRLFTTNQIRYLDLNELWILTLSLQKTVLVLSCMLGVCYCLNQYWTTIALPFYRQRFTNLKPLRKSYTRFWSHVHHSLLPNLYTGPSVLGWFVAILQYYTFARTVNLIASCLNLVLVCFMTQMSLSEDAQRLQESRLVVRVVRDQCDMEIETNQLQKKDLIHLKFNDAVPVPEATLCSKRCVFNVQANTGETNTYRVYEQHERLTNDLLCLDSYGCVIHVERTYDPMLQLSQSISFTDSIVEVHSRFTMWACPVLWLLLQVGQAGSIETISVLNMLMDAISVIILFNFMIPQMKTLPVAVVRGLMLLWLAKSRGIHWIHSDAIRDRSSRTVPWIDTQVESTPLVIVADKTGTLTQNQLSVSVLTIDPPRDMIPNELEYFVTLCLVAMNSAFEIRGELYANSPEERQMALHYRQHSPCAGIGIVFDTKPSVYNQLYERVFQCGARKIRLPMYAKEFDSRWLGRHVMFHYQGDTYCLVQYQAEQLVKVTNLCQRWQPQNLQRALMIAYRRVPKVSWSVAEFEAQWIKPYVRAMREQKQLPGVRRLAECYFHDELRSGTVDGFKRLMTHSNVSLYMCTGDSVATASDVAQQIGMRDFDTIDGTKLQLQGSFDSLSWKRSMVFAKFTALQKSELIQWLQANHRESNTIVSMFGDHNNDRLSLACCDMAFVQQQGSLDCKSVAHIEVQDLSAVYSYLFQVRRWRLFGQYWILNQMHLFNCMLCGICLIGLHTMRFEKNGLLYIDPWQPKWSLLLTNVMAVTFIALSYRIGDYCQAHALDFQHMTSMRLVFRKSVIVSVLCMFLAYFSRYFLSLNGNLAIVFIMCLMDSFSWFYM